MPGELEQGIQALERGNVEAAVQHLRRACQEAPGDYRPLVGLGSGDPGQPACRAVPFYYWARHIPTSRSPP